MVPPHSDNRIPEGGFAGLVPELDVSDLAESLRFWCDVIGFRVAYSRPESSFVYLERDGAQIMLNTLGGAWQTGPMERPFGRGINFQILVSNLASVLTKLDSSGRPLFAASHDAWYRVGDSEVCLRQCLVQDPDGYLVRLAQPLGIRSLSPAAPASSP